jgi:hypothetical protein
MIRKIGYDLFGRKVFQKYWNRYSNNFNSRLLPALPEANHGQFRDVTLQETYARFTVTLRIEEWLRFRLRDRSLHEAARIKFWTWRVLKGWEKSSQIHSTWRLSHVCLKHMWSWIGFHIFVIAFFYLRTPYACRHFRTTETIVSESRYFVIIRLAGKNLMIYILLKLVSDTASELLLT